MGPHAPRRPINDTLCLYSDTVEIDAGQQTRLVCTIATGIYRYRQRRWRRLVRTHLLASGPRYAVAPTTAVPTTSSPG